jgi:hypothetical protein
MRELGRRWRAKDQGIGVGHRSRGASCMVGGLESLIGSTVLVHLDSKVEPGFQICIRWSSGCHSCKSGGYPPVESLAEFHDDGLGSVYPESYTRSRKWSR